VDLELVRPARKYLPAYVAALERGYCPSTSRAEKRLEDLAAIAADADAFLSSCEDLEARGAPVVLPDGSRVARLPGFARWLWDGEFAGSAGLRWQIGTPELPDWCHGHVGYSVVPWKRRRGYATAALRLMLPEARKIGLPYVEVVTSPSNTASQRVILANGGEFVERVRMSAAYGPGDVLRYRIAIPAVS
jgi:predicted acetyltransferase